MSPAKKFIYSLLGVAFAGWLGANWFMGPPGLKRAYLEQYKAEHEHYLKVTKSNPFKLYLERPELNGPDSENDPGTLAVSIAFVKAYQERPEFIAEQRRILRRELFFDFFNAALVAILIIRFARKPLLDFLDEKIAMLREKVESSAQARAAAEERRAKVENQVADLPNEERRVAKQTEERIARELNELDKLNQHRIEIMKQEMGERREEQYHAAAIQLKRELVNQAMGRIAERYKTLELADAKGPDALHQTMLLDRFATELERDL